VREVEKPPIRKPKQPPSAPPPSSDSSKKDVPTASPQLKPKAAEIPIGWAGAVSSLCRLQRRDGTWSSGFRNREYDMGTTALVVTALLYAGEPRDSEVIRRAFGILRNWRPRMAYTAGIALMMVEAYCAEQGLVGDAFRHAMRRNFKNAPRWMRRLAFAARSLLLRLQAESGYWRYAPGINAADLSNTQFAAFGLYSAANLGLGVPRLAFRRLLSALLLAQQKKGPVLKSCFDVPLARLKPSDMRAMEKEAIRNAMRPKPNTPMRTAPAKDTERAVRVSPSAVRTALRTAIQDSNRNSREKPVIMARGFAYRPSKRYRPTVAMTAAGLACLAICKVMLDINTRSVNRAIRDAAAWLMLHAGRRSGVVQVLHKGIHYSSGGYTSYALCRAAVLCGIPQLLDPLALAVPCGKPLETAFYLLASCRGVVGFVGGVGGFLR